MEYSMSIVFTSNSLCTVSSPSVARRAAIETLTPSSARAIAVALPMPELPPVMIATCCLSFVLIRT